MIINVAIVEDDKSCALETKGFISKCQEELGREFNVSVFNNGVDFLNNYKSEFDIVVMDIEMPYMDGLEVARKMRELDPVVILIFMTNMSQYAVKGYEVDAIDYIVKPAQYFNFKLKLKKAVERLESRPVDSLMLARQNGVSRVAIDSILYVEVTDHKLMFHTLNGIFETGGSLNSYEKQLAKYGFSRCNHCYLVNLQYVAGINSNFVTLANNEELQISRPKRKNFLDSLASCKTIKNSGKG